MNRWKEKQLQIVDVCIKIYKNLSNRSKKLIHALAIVACIMIVDTIFNYPIRSNIGDMCSRSQTIQKYSVLQLSCAVLILDWNSVDVILSEMDLTGEYFD